MSDEELVSFAADFRDGILDGRSSFGMCFAVCAPLAGLLSTFGVGVELAKWETRHANHFWLRLPDGRVLDPTADQFNVDGEYPVVYLGPPTAIHAAPSRRPETR